MEKMPKCIVEKEFERLRAYDIVNRVESQDYSEEICEWGIRAFISVTGLAMQTQNTESMADFLDDGGCEAIITMLNKHAVTNTEIAAKGCLVLCILAWSLRELKEFLGEIGACEIAVFVTSVHIGDPEVSEFGSGAIGLLGKNNIANSLRLAEAGACDVISQVGNFGFNLQHDRCNAVATNVCLAFALLCEAANAGRLLECGAAGLVVALVRFHEDDKVFAAASMKALCGISSLNVQLREELGRCGACAAVLGLFRKHYENITLIQDCAEAIMHLSLSPTNSEKLGSDGACEVLIEALDQKLMDHDFGAEVCTCALVNLCMYGSKASESREKSIDNGAVPLLRRTQHSKKASYRARESISKLLDLLGADAVPGSISNSNSYSINLNTLGSASKSNISSVDGGDSGNFDPKTGHSRRRSRTASGCTTISANSNGGGNGNGSYAAVSNAGIAASATTCSGSGTAASTTKLVGVVHGSEMKGDTVPLHVEIRETLVEYDSFEQLILSDEDTQSYNNRRKQQATSPRRNSTSTSTTKRRPKARSMDGGVGVSSSGDIGGSSVDDGGAAATASAETSSGDTSSSGSSSGGSSEQSSTGTDRGGAKDAKNGKYAAVVDVSVSSDASLSPISSFLNDHQRLRQQQQRQQHQQRHNQRAKNQQQRQQQQQQHQHANRPDSGGSLLSRLSENPHSGNEFETEDDDDDDGEDGNSLTRSRSTGNSTLDFDEFGPVKRRGSDIKRNSQGAYEI